MTGFGVGLKRPTVKSSTTKGAKALAGESNRRRRRTAKACCCRVRGSFCILSPEIVGNAIPDGNYAAPGGVDIQQPGPQGNTC